ncbi:Hypothetical predicted protein [Mytilus galloprovincialis]|uniref:Uncharacterized protein n=1 Tax=Mytilus galloprovincialis TaxID=29158 RepID=A0A8B6BUY4_MYTGA|nr:Hypothetical predicted protein [Mytilus galloprovincialis]
MLRNVWIQTPVKFAYNHKEFSTRDSVIQEKEVSFTDFPTLKQNPVKKRVIFHHSSIPKFIDIKRLTASFQLEGLAKRTATLADFEGYIQQEEGKRYCKLNDPDFCENINSDIICLLETKADKEDNVCLKGYTLLKKVARPRKGKAIHGGIALYARSNVSKGITLIKGNSSEFLWAKLSKTFFSHSSDIFVCFAYNSPIQSSYSKSLKSELTTLEKIEQDLIQPKVWRQIPMGLLWNNEVQKMLYRDDVIKRKLNLMYKSFLSKDRVPQRNGVDEATEDLTDIFNNILDKLRSHLNLPKGNRFKSKNVNVNERNLV